MFVHLTTSYEHAPKPKPPIPSTDPPNLDSDSSSESDSDDEGQSHNWGHLRCARRAPLRTVIARRRNPLSPITPLTPITPGTPPIIGRASVASELDRALDKVVIRSDSSVFDLDKLVSREGGSDVLITLGSPDDVSTKSIVGAKTASEHVSTSPPELAAAPKPKTKPTRGLAAMPTGINPIVRPGPKLHSAAGDDAASQIISEGEKQAVILPVLPVKAITIPPARWRNPVHRPGGGTYRPVSGRHILI